MARTLNLYDGLEALYYFDTDYFDGGTDEISDRSGYGRHASASGGPSIGVSGPDNFEAASFDGSDDEFQTPYTQTESAKTVAALVRVDVDDFSGIVTPGGGNEYLRWIDSPSRIQARLSDASGSNVQLESSSLSLNKWYFALYRWDEQTFELFIDGEQEDATPLSAHINFDNNYYTGSRGGSAFFSGAIAFTGIWSRALSDAEIDYLNRLTGPRRSQL